MKTLKKVGQSVFRVFVRFIYILSAAYLFIRYCPKVIYTDKKKTREAVKKSPCIFISNHTSHNDGFFVPRMLKKYKVFTFVAKDWYEKKFAYPFFKCLDYIPMDRVNLDTEWITDGINKIKEGHSILIFPEGKTSKTVMNEFKPGFLYLSKRTGAPVIPMCIIGEYKFLKRQKLVIGTPVDMNLKEKGRPSEVLGKYSARCKDEVQKLLNEYGGKYVKIETDGEKKVA